MTNIIMIRIIIQRDNTEHNEHEFLVWVRFTLELIIIINQTLIQIQIT